MEQKRIYRTRPPRSAARQPGARSNISYNRRPVVARDIDAMAGHTRGMIPASQQEYIDSLSGAAPKLSRFARQALAVNPNDSFQAGARKIFLVLRNSFFQIKSSLPALVIFAFMFVAIVGMASTRSGRTAEADRSIGRASVESLIDTGAEISERRPTNMQSYQVADDLPRMFYIDDMGISARVRRVGVGTDTEIRLPSNIYDAGWYESSVKPGENGAVVLTGHASGPSKPGIFHDLTELKPGDEFKIETGGGQIYAYYVAKLQAFQDDDPLAPMLAPAVPGVPGLNLITETGAYDAVANTYDQRLVVYAVQKNMFAPVQKPSI